MGGHNVDPLTEKLQRIAELEERHDLLGIRFGTRENAGLRLEDTSDFVIKAINMALELAARKDQITLYEPDPPS